MYPLPRKTQCSVSLAAAAAAAVTAALVANAMVDVSPSMGGNLALLWRRARNKRRFRVDWCLGDGGGGGGGVGLAIAAAVVARHALHRYTGGSWAKIWREVVAELPEQVFLAVQENLQRSTGGVGISGMFGWQYPASSHLPGAGEAVRFLHGRADNLLCRVLNTSMKASLT